MPTFSERPLVFPNDPNVRAVGDIDLDGRLDLIKAFNEELTWYENQIGLRLSVTGMGVRGFFCRNRTSGQSVRIATADAEVDCENEGLTVAPGDEIEVFARGQVD